MAYAVNSTRRAERDLEDIYSYISDSETALVWYRGLAAAILTLEQHPERCPTTPETSKLRQLLYGKKRIYRVIFQLNHNRKVVEVLHIRHGARRSFEPAELVIGSED